MLSFVGTRDPIKDLENFQTHLDLHDTPDEAAWRAFPFTLLGSARDWFRNLSPNSINKFEDLSKKFLA